MPNGDVGIMGGSLEGLKRAVSEAAVRRENNLTGVIAVETC